MVAFPLLAFAFASCEAPRGDVNPNSIDWQAMKNPVLAFPDHAVKDAYAIRDDDGGWHLGFSYIADDPFRFRVGTARASPAFEDVTLGDVYDDDRVGGLASPTVVRAPDGRYVMTYNSHTVDVDGTANKVYFRTSNDLVTWSDGTRIVIEGANGPDDRVIDGALAFTDDAGAFLFFKLEQAANVAHAPTGAIEGPWTLLGEIEPLNLENCQPILIDDVWHLLGTTIPIDHRAVLHRLEGDPSDPQAWRTWSAVRELVVPAEEWNRGPFPGSEKSNAAFLIDERDVDGFFYLLYAGSTELATFEGRGHAKLGLARSEDLEIWHVP